MTNIIEADPDDKAVDTSHETPFGQF